jgi:hypothetical protein
VRQTKADPEWLVSSTVATTEQSPALTGALTVARTPSVWYVWARFFPGSEADCLDAAFDVVVWE